MNITSYLPSLLGQINKPSNPNEANQKLKLLVMKSLAFSQAACRLINQCPALAPVYEMQVNRVYRTCVSLLQTLNLKNDKKTTRAIGLMTRAFRRIDDALSKQYGFPLHRYCGCHIEGKGVQKKQSLTSREMKALIPYPSVIEDRPQLKNRSAILYSWPMGGGHDVVQTSLGKRCAKAQMHVYKVDASADVLIAVDGVANLTKTFGIQYSTVDLVRFLMRKNCWGILNMLDRMYSGPESEEQRAVKEGLFSHNIVKYDPDVVISCFSRVSGSIANGAAAVGRPMYNSASDFDPQVCDIQKPSDIKNPHFAHVLLVRDKQLEKTIDGVLDEKQLALGGFPVRSVFTKPYSKAEIEQLRDKWKVADEARVVLVLSGGEGVENMCAESIVNGYRKNSDDSFPKVRLIVICGKNAEEKSRLEKQFSSLKDQRIQTTVLGWTNEEDMGELYAMAALVISAKGGGATLSEAVARGVPILVQDLNDVSWEKNNIDFVCRMDLGSSFKNNDEIWGKFQMMMARPFAPKQTYHDFPSEAASMAVVERLVGDAERDPQFYKQRHNYV